MGMFANLKNAGQAFVRSYEAAGVMGLCLSLSAVFALAAAVIWVAQMVGTILSCLAFSALFLVAGLIMKLVSGREEQEAETKLKVATQGPVGTALAVAHVLRPPPDVAMRSILPPALLILLLLTALYLGSTKPPSHL